MKKFLIILSLLITAACSPRGSYLGENWNYDKSGYDKTPNSPEWVSNSSVGGYIGGVGLGSKKIEGGLQKQRHVEVLE